MGIKSFVKNLGRSKEKTPAEEQEIEIDMSKVTKIIVACNAGVGSSAIGASMLRKKVEQENLEISVINRAINDLPGDVDIVITHENFTSNARKHAPNAYHISLLNFLDNKLYTELVAKLKKAHQGLI